MLSTRAVVAVLVVLCAAAAWGSPLPQEIPADAPSEDDKPISLEGADTEAPDVGDNAEGANVTEVEGDQEVTATPTEETHTTEKGADAEEEAEGEGGPNFEKRAAQEQAEDSPKEDEFHVLLRREGEHGDELEIEKERRRREESSDGEHFEFAEGEESNSDEGNSASTKSSEEESSTDAAPTDSEAGEEPVEGGQVAALQSADAIASEGNAEAVTDVEETTGISADSTNEAGETVVPGDEAESSDGSEDASDGSDVSDGRRRRRRVPLKEETDLEGQQQFSNDTEQEVDESVKSVALN